MGRRPTRDRSTIGDVATRAGVSRATVSRVMNGLASVDHAIAERVRATAVELDYRPNQVARSLALGRTQTIGYVVPDLTNPSFHGGLRGLSRAAAEQGYRVLVADSAEHAAGEPTLALETRRRCDAVVLVAPRMSEEDLARLLPDLQPAVLLNRRLRGGAAAVRCRLGVRDPRSGAPPDRARPPPDRLPAGAGGQPIQRRSGEGAGRSADVEVVKIACGAMFADGHAAAGRVLDAGVTAVVAFNDVAALGLLGALHELGTDVPGELSVVGFDDIPFAAYTWPPLTTAWVPQEQMGRLAWERLSAMLAGEPAASPVETECAAGLLRPRLVVRGSTGRPIPA